MRPPEKRKEKVFLEKKLTAYYNWISYFSVLLFLRGWVGHIWENCSWLFMILNGVAVYDEGK